MRLTYSTYHIRDEDSGNLYRVDLDPFLSAFCNFPNTAFKLQFTDNGEHIFLLKLGVRFYGFARTCDTDIVRRINNDDITMDDLDTLLRENERLAMMSYVYIDINCVCFAATSLAPRLAAFSRFVSDIFQRAKLHVYKLVVIPILDQASFSELFQAAFVGTSSVQLRREQNEFHRLAEGFGWAPNEYNDVDSIEITVHAKNRKDIKKPVRTLLSIPGVADSPRIKCRAKLDDVADPLVDIYLTGQGHLNDPITKDNDALIRHQIQIATTRNLKLRQEINRFSQDDSYSNSYPQPIRNLHDHHRWDSLI